MESHYAIYDDILVATDGSDGEMAAAAEQGLDLAAEYDATVHALCVVDTNRFAFEDVPRSIVGILEKSGNRVFEEAVTPAQIENLTDFRYYMRTSVIDP